jgi:flagellum-specific ATP synthase
MKALISEIGRIDPIRLSGRVVTISGLLIEARGPLSAWGVGARLAIIRRGGEELPCEVVGFRDDRALLMPYGALEGVRPGAEVRLQDDEAAVRPTAQWLGRVIDSFGQPIDGLGALPDGDKPYAIKALPPVAHTRARLGPRMDMGVRSLDVFTTCCIGQRLGVFAGSGVGKSVLLSMLARQAQCDVVVVGLIGERGREVKEFLEETLGEEGLKRSVIVVATSDEPALARRQAAYTTMAVAEYFRDQGKHVLCLMDSVTRFAMAQREIGLAAGEPPTTKGYTPTVFAELPKLLERAGPGVEVNGKARGNITALFTVLVDGDDHNEPVADAVRGILDGHIVMQRSIAERGRFPAVNVLKSISRTMPDCQEPAEYALVKQARILMSAYSDMEELIRIGAYRRGTDPMVDRAIALNGDLEAFLSQDKQETATRQQAFKRLESILSS